MKTLICSMAATVVLFFAVPISADIVYVFQDNSTTIGAALDGQTTGMFTQTAASGTVQLTATATPSGDAFNSTASGFGINQSASGDDTDAFDFTGGAGVAEGLTLSFDMNVLLEAIDVSSWSATDEVQIVVGGTTVATISSTGSTSLGAFAVSAGTLVSINTTAGTYGNGWSLDSFDVSKDTAGVPEPGSAVVLGLLWIAAIGQRRRR